MTEIDFKAQAARLSAHLATHHGVKIKASSALEAVAAMHGARDWNTLAASQTPSPARMAATSKLPAKLDFLALRHAQVLMAELLNVNATRLTLTTEKVQENNTWHLEYQAPESATFRTMPASQALEVVSMHAHLAKLSLEPNTTAEGSFMLRKLPGTAACTVAITCSNDGAPTRLELQMIMDGPALEAHVPLNPRHGRSVPQA